MMSDGNDDVENKFGPVYRHEAPDEDLVLASGDDESIAAIGAHIEEHLGPIDSVFHELVSDRVHVDIHRVPPTDEVPFLTLVTSGMSDRPMNAPDELDGVDYAELVMFLPPMWKLDEEDLEDERNYWPVRQLKRLARLPHRYDTWLWESHSVPNGDPPEPFAPDTELCGVVLIPPILAPEGFETLELGPDKTVHFFAVMPLYAEEMQVKLENGVDALYGMVDEFGHGPVVDPTRPNLVELARQ
jgi:hypothetical protein